LNVESREVNQHAWRAKGARPVICELNTHAQRTYSQRESDTVAHHVSLALGAMPSAQCLQLKKPAMLLSTMHSDAIMQRCIVRLYIMMLHMAGQCWPMLARELATCAGDSGTLASHRSSIATSSVTNITYTVCFVACVRSTHASRQNNTRSSHGADDSPCRVAGRP
jgi:hypothetical protein